VKNNLNAKIVGETFYLADYLIASTSQVIVDIKYILEVISQKLL